MFFMFFDLVGSEIRTHHKSQEIHQLIVIEALEIMKITSAKTLLDNSIKDAVPIPPLPLPNRSHINHFQHNPYVRLHSDP